jgi:hypothetical protein
MSKISPIHAVLGDAFNQLPAAVRCAHDNNGYMRLVGTADVERGGGLIGDLICWIVGLPRKGNGQKAVIEFTIDDKGFNHWSRNFNGRVYCSHMHVGTGSHVGKLVEYLSFWTGVFALEAKPDRIVWTLTELAMLGIVLPPWLSLKCEAFEAERNGRYLFDIRMDVPWLGHLISYRGEMELLSDTAAPPQEIDRLPLF